MPSYLNTLPLPDLRDELVDGAECRFDPELHDGPDPQTTIEHPEARAAREDVAREICEGCPVRDMCLEYATRVHPTRGVWAGRSADELNDGELYVAVLATTGDDLGPLDLNEVA